MEPSLGTSQQGSRVDEIKATFKNAIALVKNPIQYMTANKGATMSVNSLMINYVAILALVPLVGRLIGDLLYYDKAFDNVGYAVAGTIVSYFLDIISVFLVGYIIWWLAPRYSSLKDRPKATMLAAFAFTPAFLIGILSIVPFLGLLSILGLLYGLYILYKGLPIVMNTPSKDNTMYFIVILVVAFVIDIIIALIVGAFDGLATKQTIPTRIIPPA